jgi:hypothetical protein
MVATISPHRAPIEACGHAWDDQAGQHRKDARDRNRRSGQALRHAQIGRDRRQQADRHELGGDEDHDAQRHREHRASTAFVSHVIGLCDPAPSSGTRVGERAVLNNVQLVCRGHHFLCKSDYPATIQLGSREDLQGLLTACQQ